MKICYFDVETTGILPGKHDIVEIACVIEINHNVVNEFAFELQPFDYTTIDEGALSACNTTVEDLKKRMLPHVMYPKLLREFGKHVNKYDRSDKFYPAGFNVRFDIDFLGDFFRKNNDQYYGSWFNWKAIDPLPILNWLDLTGKVHLEKRTLSHACEYFGIELGQAHVALNDIRATRELIKLLWKEYFE